MEIESFHLCKSYDKIKIPSCHIIFWNIGLRTKWLNFFLPKINLNRLNIFRILVFCQHFWFFISIWLQCYMCCLLINVCNILLIIKLKILIEYLLISDDGLFSCSNLNSVIRILKKHICYILLSTGRSLI